MGIFDDFYNTNPDGSPNPENRAKTEKSLGLFPAIQQPDETLYDYNRRLDAHKE